MTTLEQVQKMTDDELNERVALLCGYVRMRTSDIVGRLKDMGIEVSETKEQFYWNNPAGQIVAVPDFCNDLNVMHNAEKTLPKVSRDSYAMWLWAEDMVKHDRRHESAGWDMAHASARQRAEAFAMLLGGKE